MPVADREIRFPNLLVFNRNFVLIWCAYGVSAIGDHLSEMALIQHSGGFARTDLTRVQALLTFGFFLPYVLFGPVAGWWADRFSRKWTMIATDLIRAAVMISIPVTVPFFFHLGCGDYSIVLPLLVTGAFAAFFSPARTAMIPTIVRDDQLVRANAMISAMGTIGGILSALLGGKLVDMANAGHFHIDWNYRLDALSFFLSSSFLIFISLRLVRGRQSARLTGVWTPIVEGFRYVRGHRRVLQMILIGTVFWAAGGVLISVVPAIVKIVFGGTFTDAGLYRGLIAAGLALGAALMTVLGPSLPTSLAVMFGLFGGGAWVLGLDAAFLFKLGRVFSAVCLFMVGVHGAFLLIPINVVIQRFVPDARRGRVFGVLDMTTMGAMVIATGLLGVPHIPRIDVHIPYLLGVVGLGLLAAFGAATREYLCRGDVPPLLSLLWKLARFYAAFWCRVQRDGHCTVPRNGAVILAANHTAGVDPLVIQGTCHSRVVSFLVAKEYYETPLAGWFMRQVHCVPIDREHPSKSFLAGSLRLLKSGGCLGIFPQGTFENPAEERPEVKAGVGVLALRSGAVVVPCHISGTRYHANPFVAFFVRHRVRVKYGRPIDLSEFAGLERQRDTAQRVSELIMKRIEELGSV